MKTLIINLDFTQTGISNLKESPKALLESMVIANSKYNYIFRSIQKVFTTKQENMLHAICEFKGFIAGSF